MLYYLDTEVDWRKNSGLNDLEKEVKEGIRQIQATYFSTNSFGEVKLVWPKGKPEEVHRVFGVRKKYPIELKSPDGMWRYTKSRAKFRNGRQDYDDHHLFVTHNTTFHERDLELLWYLINKSAPLKTKEIYIENLEEEATHEAEVRSTDADIRFMIYSHKSPISTDEKQIRQVAEIFGIKDIDKMGIMQVKNKLYDELVAGEKGKDRFINFNKFEELTEGNNKRKAAFVARRAISDGIVGYRNRAWYLKEGREYAEKLFDIPAKEVEDRNVLFIEEMVNNPNIRSRVYDYMGEDEGVTADELWELDRWTLIRKCEDKGIEGIGHKSNKEDSVRALCEKMGIEFKPKQSA